VCVLTKSNRKLHRNEKWERKWQRSNCQFPANDKWQSMIFVNSVLKVENLTKKLNEESNCSINISWAFFKKTILVPLNCLHFFQKMWICFCRTRVGLFTFFLGFFKRPQVQRQIQFLLLLSFQTRLWLKTFEQFSI